MEFESLNSFLNYLETIKNKSDNTITNYKSDLEGFLKYIRENADIKSDNDLNKIDLNTLYMYIGYCEKVRGNNAKSRCRKVASLKSYFNFIYRKLKLIDENIAEDLESPKVPKRQPKYLTVDESIKLLRAIDDDPDNCNYFRDKCIVVLFLNTGMRLSELCNIKIKDIQSDNTLRIIGKGDKERIAYLNPMCIKTIDNYLNNRKAESEYLFLSTKRNKVSTNTVEVMVKKYIKKAGLDEGITPHKLRHSFATQNYQSGNCDLNELQTLLGHESLSTTSIYSHIESSSLKKAMDNSPLINAM